MSPKKRYIYIDYLKVLGLLLVILAHVSCPTYLMQLRSFDVPLLVFISGFLASKSFSDRNIKGYYWRRIKRLAFPAWIFLAFFFVVQGMVYAKPSAVEIIKGFTFQRDSQMVGMLWVIWVYFVCSLMIPLVNKIGFGSRRLLCVWGVIIIFELLCATTNLHENRALYISLFTMVPWGCVTYIGFYYDKFSNVQKRMLLLASLCSFVITAGWLFFKCGHFVPTNDYKYPARLYYLSYAFVFIVILFEVMSRVNIQKNSVITFISQSSLWIYLWHILFLYAVKLFITNDRLWIVQYVAIVLLSVFVTFIQNAIIARILKKRPNEFLKIFLG